MFASLLHLRMGVECITLCCLCLVDGERFGDPTGELSNGEGLRLWPPTDSFMGGLLTTMVGTLFGGELCRALGGDS